MGLSIIKYGSNLISNTSKAKELVNKGIIIFPLFSICYTLFRKGVFANDNEKNE